MVIFAAKKKPNTQKNQKLIQMTIILKMQYKEQ